MTEAGSSSEAAGSSIMPALMLSGSRLAALASSKTTMCSNLAKRASVLIVNH